MVFTSHLIYFFQSTFITRTTVTDKVYKQKDANYNIKKLKWKSGCHNLFATSNCTREISVSVITMNV